MSDAGQRRTVRQCLVQPVTENPPDRMLERTSRGRRRSWMTPTSKLASMSRTRLRRNAIQKGASSHRPFIHAEDLALP